MRKHTLPRAQWYLGLAAWALWAGLIAEALRLPVYLSVPLGYGAYRWLFGLPKERQ